MTPISYELAKLLKAKGFGLSKDDYIQLPRFYESDGNYVENHLTVSKKYNPMLDTMSYLGADTINNFEARIAMMDNSLDNIYLAPTIAEVVTWLYEKHNLWITVIPINSQAFSRAIWENKIIDVTNNCNDYSDFTFHYTPTEAYEAAIEYALKEVIN
jgi:hypothetical protein